MKNLIFLLFLFILLVTKIYSQPNSRIQINLDSLGNNSKLTVNTQIFEAAASMLFLENNISDIRITDLFWDAVDGSYNFQDTLRDGRIVGAYRPTPRVTGTNTEIYAINLIDVENLFVEYGGSINVNGRPMTLQLLFAVTPDGIQVIQKTPCDIHYVMIPDYEAYNPIEANAKELNTLIIEKLNSCSQGFMADKKNNERDPQDRKEK